MVKIGLIKWAFGNLAGSSFFRWRVLHNAKTPNKAFSERHPKIGKMRHFLEKPPLLLIPSLDSWTFFRDK